MLDITFSYGWEPVPIHRILIGFKWIQYNTCRYLAYPADTVMKKIWMLMSKWKLISRNLKLARKGDFMWWFPIFFLCSFFLPIFFMTCADHVSYHFVGLSTNVSYFWMLLCALLKVPKVSDSTNKITWLYNYGYHIDLQAYVPCSPRSYGI